MTADLEHDRVRDGAEGPDGGGPVAVLLPCHVLGQRGGHDDHVLGYVGQLLDAQVHQPSQHSVLGLNKDKEVQKACIYCAMGMLTISQIKTKNSRRKNGNLEIFQ